MRKVVPSELIYTLTMFGNFWRTRSATFGIFKLELVKILKKRYFSSVLGRARFYSTKPSWTAGPSAISSLHACPGSLADRASISSDRASYRPPCATCSSWPPRAAHAAPPPCAPPLSPLFVAITSKGEAKPHFSPPLSLLTLLLCRRSSPYRAARQVIDCLSVASSFSHRRLPSVSHQPSTRAALKPLCRRA
jgi:hypothetical protein